MSGDPILTRIRAIKPARRSLNRWVRAHVADLDAARADTGATWADLAAAIGDAGFGPVTAEALRKAYQRARTARPRPVAVVVRPDPIRPVAPAQAERPAGDVRASLLGDLQRRVGVR